jgi:hypothetical protein
VNGNLYKLVSEHVGSITTIRRGQGYNQGSYIQKIFVFGISINFVEKLIGEEGACQLLEITSRKACDEEAGFDRIFL